MKTIKKAEILLLSVLAGAFAGLPIYLFASFCLFLWYGDNGHPTKLMIVVLFYGTFVTTALIGLGAGLLIIDKHQSSPSGSVTRQQN